MDARELVTSLTNEELAKRLRSLKEDIGPITPTTRPLYEKRLLRCLLLEQAATCTIPYSRKADGEISGAVNGVGPKCLNGGTDLPVMSDAKPHVPDDVDRSDTTFYGVQLQTEVHTPTSCHVFMNKDDAIRLIKEKKGGRFKAFNKRSEAEEFSKMPILCTNTTCTVVTTTSQPATSKPLPSESSSFRSLKIQELLPFRRAIEMEDLESIRNMIWSNPRFLIGSGDNPTILHEGSRYNALHICATKNKPNACKLILDTVEDVRFAQLLYPDDTEETRRSRIDFFTDLYLNTPDRHLGETPLHFACKYGFTEMVAILVSHPCTDRHLKNINGQTPRDVICGRITNATTEIKQKIIALFDNLYYVRMIGSYDNSCSAKVLPPWSPCERVRANDPDIDQMLSPVRRGCDNNTYMSSPCDLPVTVKAYAGPMSSHLAEQFHDVWIASPGSVPRDRRREFAQIRRGDSTKGLERIGREISRQMNVPWSEYWAFLDCLIDLESPEGLKKFEDHLRHRLKEVLGARALEELEQKKRDMSVCQMLEQLHLNSDLSDAEERALHVDCVQTWPPSLAKPSYQTQNGSVSCGVGGINSDDMLGGVTENGLVNDTASNASEDSFHTAEDDLDLEYSLVSEWPDEYDVESVDAIFIYGEKPCKTDVDVFRALETADICPVDYPLVYRWRNTVLSYPEEVRNKWVPHERLKYNTSNSRPVSSSTPSHDQSFENFDLSNCSELDEMSSSFEEPSVRKALWQN